MKIQGILEASGGIKTSIGGNRIELGNYLGLPDRLVSYLTGDKRIVLAGHVLSFYDTGGASRLQMSSGGLSGGVGCFIYTQSYMKAASYIRTEDVFKVGANPVVGARGAAVADPPYVSAISVYAGDDTIDRNTFNTALGVMRGEINILNLRFRDLLAHFRTWGSIAS